ncbi:MAG: cation diffusion facilitator family transporter [bacterium]|nr:cation diffusion facilitator family transporter [bacterium]
MDTKVRVTVLGSIINIVLVIIKILWGILGRSYSLIADGLHSLSDLVTDVIVLLGLFIGKKPPDVDHHYGHKKIENFAELGMGIVLIIVAVKLGFNSFEKTLEKDIPVPEMYTIILAFISVVFKEYLYQITKKVADSSGSDSILANAWHHRSDALTSIAVLTGLVLSIFVPGLIKVDAFMGMSISVFIVYIGIKIGIKASKKLSDIAPSKEYIEKVRAFIEEIAGVDNCHLLRMRYLGEKIYIECHIEVDPRLTVEEGHNIATEIKANLLKWDNKIAEVMIHIEPKGDHISDDKLHFK